MKALSKYAMVIALGIAIVISLVPDLAKNNTVKIVMVLLGVAAGVLNCIGERSRDFLIAVIALMLVGSAADQIDNVVKLGDIVSRILKNVLIVAAPAGLVIAVKLMVTNAKQD